MCWWLQIRKDRAHGVVGREGQEVTPGGKGHFCLTFRGDLGGASAPGHLEAASQQLLRGLDPVSALPWGHPGRKDLRRFLGVDIRHRLIFILFWGSRVIDFLQPQLTRALEESFQ